MFHRRIPSDDEDYYLVDFECRDLSGNLYNIYLGGKLLSRVFIRGRDLNKLEDYVKNLIESGRLTIDHPRLERRGEVVLSSIERIDKLVRVELRTDSVLEVEDVPLPPIILDVPRQSLVMVPLSTWSISERVEECIRTGDFYGIIELLESVKPTVEERGITRFDGKTVHPISTRTLLSRMEIYSKGLRRVSKRECRTILLLDRSLSMGNSWSRWEEVPKIEVGRLLVEVIQALQPINHLFSFGSEIREEDGPRSITASDRETRLDLALKEVELYNPEKLVIITDGKPVYSPRKPLEDMCNECIYVLDALSRSGVNILIIMLGNDLDMFKFYRMLRENPRVTLIDLSSRGRGFTELLYKLSRYIYEV